MPVSREAGREQKQIAAHLSVMELGWGDEDPMDQFARTIGRSLLRGNLRDPATVRLWARVLGVPEADVLDAISVAGPSTEAVLLYLHAPD